MRLLIHRWTLEDDQRLKALVESGASVTKAAAALKRREAPVRERARKLGYAFLHLAEARKKWTNTPDNSWRSY